MDEALRRRAGVLSAAFAALFFGLVVRLYCLQIASHDEYSARRAAQTSGRAVHESWRGELLDRSGEILAVSVPMDAVWANPSALEDRPAAARLLAAALGLRAADVLEDLHPTPDDGPVRQFQVIKKRLTPAEAQAVRLLMADPVFAPGGRSRQARIGLQPEYVRRYPHGALLGQTLGFLSLDPGQSEGLERVYDPVLNGERRVVDVRVDGRGRALAQAHAASAGATVILSIDLGVQSVVEEELSAACAEFRPRWASAVALDPRSGAVLAMANRPRFDPNDPGRAGGEARLNRAVAVPYEPGSTLKPFLAAVALDRGLVRPETKFDCENGLWVRGARRLHDTTPHGVLTLAEGIKLSSNILAAKLGAEKLGRERMYEGLRAFGFGEPTGVDLPAEDDGRLRPPARWSSFTETSIPIGHEITVTSLQLVAAMAALANGGTLYRPYVVSRVVAADGTVLAANGPQAVRRVVGEKAARETVEMLKAVVRDGTGKNAQVRGLVVAGKTGTTQKVDPRTGKYTHERFISSFVGFAPADGARVCVVVVLDEPQGAYYGGTVAAPVVGKILERGLVYVR